MSNKKESGIALLTIEELKSLIQQRLKFGWVVILGDPQLVQVIEATAYPPGTNESKLFELLMGPTLPGFGVFLAKKTDKLANLLGSPPDLDKTICLEFMGGVGDKVLLVNQTLAKEGCLNNAINQLIQRLVSK